MPEKTLEAKRPAAPSAKDRRVDPRYKFTGIAEVMDKKSGVQVEARVTDLGPRGCFLTSGNPFPIGTIVTVRIVKSSKMFEAGARVAFSAESRGMGLFFTNIETSQKATLAEWLSSSLETSWLASTRRQSQRLLLRLPVRINGENAKGAPFDEKAYTQVVSAHGALILLSTSVSKSQRLVMTNERAKESVECIVAHIGEVDGNMTQVGVSFLLPDPKFWKVTFPPEDWSIRHPDAKSKSNARPKG
jgi:PilZ domain